MNKKLSFTDVALPGSRLYANDLQTALELAKIVSPGRASYPVLDHTLFTTREGHGLLLQATNRDVYLTVVVNSKNEGPWQLALPTKQLSTVVKASGSEVINIEHAKLNDVDEKGQPMIKTAGVLSYEGSFAGRSVVRGIDPENFPTFTAGHGVFPTPENIGLKTVASFEMDLVEFQKAAAYALAAVGRDDNRPTLNAINVAHTPAGWRMIGCNGFHATLTTVPTTNNVVAHDKQVYELFNVPQAIFEVIGKLKAKQIKEGVQVTFFEQWVPGLYDKAKKELIIKVSVTCGPVNVMADCVVGKYPDVNGIFTTKGTMAVTSGADFLKLVNLEKANGGLADSANFMVTANEDTQKLVVSSEKGTDIFGQTELAAQVMGKTVKVCLETSYLLELLKVAKGVDVIHLYIQKEKVKNEVEENFAATFNDGELAVRYILKTKHFNGN